MPDPVNLWNCPWLFLQKKEVVYWKLFKKLTKPKAYINLIKEFISKISRRKERERESPWQSYFWWIAEDVRKRQDDFLNDLLPLVLISCYYVYHEELGPLNECLAAVGMEMEPLIYDVMLLCEEKRMVWQELFPVINIWHWNEDQAENASRLIGKAVKWTGS